MSRIKKNEEKEEEEEEDDDEKEEVKNWGKEDGSDEGKMSFFYISILTSSAIDHLL